MLDRLELINQEINDLDKKISDLQKEKTKIEKEQYDKDFSYIKSLEWLDRIREFEFILESSSFRLNFNLVHDFNLVDQLKSFIKKDDFYLNVFYNKVVKDITLYHDYNENFSIRCHNFDTFCSEILSRVDLNKIKISENTHQGSIIVNLILKDRQNG